LEPLLNLLQQRRGSIVVDLDRAQHRAFVDAYLDHEPNRLGPTFRETLFGLSGGHALFTVELVRMLQERGSLVRDRAGRWIEGATLDWETLPTRIEAVIGERVGRLPVALRALLEIAAVQGEQFSAEIVAELAGESRDAVVRRLSDELDRRHQLLVAQGIRRTGAGRRSFYRFRHVLFQRYLYGSLDPVTRGWLHEQVAAALERHYAAVPEALAEHARQLAWHYRQAELPEPAVRYLCLAGNRALELVTYEEAETHFRDGLALLAQVPAGAYRAHWELQLLMGLGTVLAITMGMAAHEVEQTFSRADALCDASTAAEDRVRILWHLWLLYFQRGLYQRALTLGESCLNIARRAAAPDLLLEAHLAVGPTLYRMGDFAASAEHLAEAHMLYDAQHELRHLHAYAHDPGADVRANEALVLWYLGYGDQARRRCAEALAGARATEHGPTLAWTLIFAAALYRRMGDATQTAHYSVQALAGANEYRLALWQGVGALYHGWALTAGGDPAAGLDKAQRGLDAIHATGMAHVRFVAVLADALLRAGRHDASAALLDPLFSRIEANGEREWEAELCRLRGELLLAEGRRADAAAWCERALAVAAAQQAKSLELRAALSLQRVLQAQGRDAEGRRRLAAVYGWFSEGFDLPDLVHARRALAEDRAGAASPAGSSRG
jgi:adenylate cyclase